MAAPPTSLERFYHRTVGSIRAVIRRLDTLTRPSRLTSYASGPTVSSDAWSWDAGSYARLYTTQPHVRTVVDFIARNVAQLGLHVYRRVSDTDRVRLTDHPVALLLANPNPSTTAYRMVESTVQDFAIYFNAYWLKVRQPDRLQLVRIPPEQMTPDGFLFPTAYLWQWPTGERFPLPPSEVIHFRGYDPRNPIAGLSPLETLRRLLGETTAVVGYRSFFWRNAARLGGVIQRPKDAPRWTKEQREEFRSDWRELYEGVANAGKTPVLEDGMAYVGLTSTARDAQLVESRKLTREEVAAAYHVPLPMVGILDHATFSNIREQHKQLYQDCLGPMLRMLEDELQDALRDEFVDNDFYLEFNIAEKLKGSFEEQADALRTMAGAPVLSRNEARARLNLPRIADPDFDTPVTPLNLTTDPSGAAAATGAAA
jgi:HK97 family phage portal protein